MAKNNATAPTYERLINQEIRRLVLLITLIISVVILVIVGTQQTLSTSREARDLMTSLNQANIKDVPSFIHWNNSTTRNTKQPAFIRVTTNKTTLTTTTKSKRTILTSPSSKAFFAKRQTKLVGSLVYVRGFGLFLAYTQKDGQNTYQLWVSLRRLINSLLVLIALIIIVMLAASALGTWWAHRLALRLSTPTVTLLRETEYTSNDPEADQPTLTIPESPREINDLGRAFNNLLLAQNQRLQHERQFISDASHELRTPIAAIRGNLSLIRRRGDSHPEVIPESLAFIDEESLRMQHLIENLLHLSRADRAKIELSDQDLSYLVLQLGEHYQPSLAPQKLQLEIDQNIHVKGNADMLQQIVVALLDNAHKYSPVDQPITLRLHQTDDAIELAVADHGEGIPDDQKTAVFQRFYRVDQSRSQAIEGSGLGLAIVQQLVALNQATIKITNNQPRGSIFTVRWELKK
ncbi:two-component sensor histidine kinase [Lactobacillus pentosus] [Lactiplantibacillus mudanjiangensis]|uniref:sensor histidine kinase n=1 Tax=Lactiplantibacillus mudanjiangensis TaxID=1296538 RepID=UPI001014F27E|nr:HAMP domain-containing sensor histidine kinase [Lactiplantibacillus mudanjiangensis]VDG21118.1 two-component sensor histidine kinase [Lactobacillus pentosus] [Lactiplantibacillus mudanjiangensis]VDG31718.1 two-component sensor histidine kinase [Lactobacillus pentosus] [Lactiplantibacillus mudanjiangensis]